MKHGHMAADRVTLPGRVDEGLRAKQPERIAGMFDAIAPRYDLLNRVLSGGLDQRWRARAIAALRLQPADVLLDVCTGTADVALGGARIVHAARRASSAWTSRVRCSASGWRRHGAAAADRALLLAQGDATGLPLADGSADAATIAFGIRNVQSPDVACRELARVLRPGGRLAVLEFGLPASPRFRALYLWYARKVLPVIGRAVSRHQSAYAYLPESVGQFPPPEEFGQLLQSCGFPHVEVVPLTLGIVYLYVAQR